VRIFIIDDEESIRDSFRMYLEDQGHEVLTADRPQACAVFQGHNCDKDYPCGHLLLIDHFLPGMNGLDFIEMMEKQGCRGMVRNKILMSGDSTAVDEDRVKRIGCKVIQKPFTFAMLDKVVDNAELAVDPDEKLADLSVN